ncbi:MAG: RsmD family RNA methyltransferase [Puniceicoccales bacterium]|jgi:16S rRNA (guanine966-N2)-methyltransferase|nr:RsmD family RNA methyltransferase [Puniceicoccales bacterium]
MVGSMLEIYYVCNDTKNIIIGIEMRITGGKARGILLTVPIGVEYLRPATDFLREAVFSSLGIRTRKAFVLDLFAGVGSYGLEALSRGADACVFVENNHLAVDAMENNIKDVKKSTARNFTTKVFCHDVFTWAKTCDVKFDIIFIDPPYNMVENRGQELLAIFAQFLKPSEESRIVIEVPGSHKINIPNDIIEIRRLGRTGHSRQPNALIYGKK